VLIALAPTAAMAQNPQSSGKKLKWIALGGVIGGATLGAFAAFSGEKPAPLSAAKTNSSIVATVSSCPAPITNGAVTVAVICESIGNPVGGSSAPLTPPGTFPVTFGVRGAPTTMFTLANAQQRSTNWKLAGPAIGATSVGAFLLYRYHVRVKKADVSLRPDGAVQLAFTW
jgi:hypothetical protein